MIYIERRLETLAFHEQTSRQALTDEALEIYLAISPEVRLQGRRYASEHRINLSTAIAEACRAYFMPQLGASNGSKPCHAAANQGGTGTSRTTAAAWPD